MSARRVWRPQLTSAEQRQGWVFFFLYLLVFPFLLPMVLRLLDERWEVYAKSAAVSSAIYYLIIAVLLMAGFFSFLRHAFSLFLDWLPENLFAMGTGLVGAALGSVLVSLIPLPMALPLLTDYPQQYAISPGATVAIVVLLQPLVDEILFRGLLFGSLRKYSRLLAYVVSTLAFALCSVWQFVPLYGFSYLLLGILYIPLGLAFTWSYDNGGSVWSPILLHMACSGIALALILH
ncbi:MAG: type II CAAX endopeptidase family protein [Oscillospiraceae bacterium]